MRRLVALLAMCGFANLAFAQAPGACPLTGAVHGSVTGASQHHGVADDGHHVPASGQTETVDQSAGGDSSHPACVMAGPCGMSVAVDRQATCPSLLRHYDSVAALCDLLPPSRTTSPDTPPPKA